MSGTLENGQCPEYGRIVDSLHESRPAAKLRDALRFSRSAGHSLRSVGWQAAQWQERTTAEEKRENYSSPVRPRNDTAPVNAAIA
jgi:hypothetical protein